MGPDGGRRLLAEFVGTAMLIFFGAGTAVATGGDNIVAVALAHGLTIMVVAYAFGRTSGAHINPMVTIVLAITQRFPMVEMPFYVGAQLLGGIAGAFLIVASHGMDAVSAGLGSTELAAGVGVGGGVAAEAIGAFILVTAIHALAVDLRAPGNLAGFGIGLSLTVAILAVGAISGASLNPARTLGPFVVKAVYGEATPWDTYWVYVVGPIIGGLIAAVVYNLVAKPPKIVDSDVAEAQGAEGQVVGKAQPDRKGVK